MDIVKERIRYRLSSNWKQPYHQNNFQKNLSPSAQHLLLTRSKLLFFTIIVVTSEASEGATRVHDEWTSMERGTIVFFPIIVVTIWIMSFTSITTLQYSSWKGQCHGKSHKWFTVHWIVFMLSVCSITLGAGLSNVISGLPKYILGCLKITY